MKPTQLNLAKHQLDKAIELFLDHKDYICALTLASAAEGILAGYNPKIFNFVRDQTSLKFKSSPKEVANLFNEKRNSLKHGSPNIHTTYIDIQSLDVALMIIRAISILSNINGEFASNQAMRFNKWQKDNKIFELQE